MKSIGIGDRVRYRLSAQDVTEINRRRTTGHAIAERMKADPPEWPAGAQAHIGNEVEEGQELPAVVVAVWGSNTANLQVSLDGCDQFWATSRTSGTLPGTYTA